MSSGFNNDFNSEYYKQLLQKDEKTSTNDEVQDAEVISDTDDYLNNNTFQGLPETCIQTISKANEVKQRSSEEAKKIADVFQQLFSELNHKYGLSVKYNYNSFADKLTAIIEPRNMKAMELYLSEGYSRFRVILYQQYLQAIALLSSQIFDPKYLLSESLTFADKMITIEKLMGFMTQMNQIYEEVKVENTDSKLEKLGEEQTPEFSLDDPKVKDFLESLADSIKNKK